MSEQRPGYALPTMGGRDIIQTNGAVETKATNSGRLSIMLGDEKQRLARCDPMPEVFRRLIRGPTPDPRWAVLVIGGTQIADRGDDDLAHRLGIGSRRFADMNY